MMKTITLALVAALIGSATLSAPSFAKSRYQGDPFQQTSAFDPFHQTGFNGNQ